MKLFACMTISALLLTACGTSHYQYQSEKNPTQWKGKSIQTLKKQWGDADQTLVTRTGGAYYVYLSNSGPSFYNSTSSNFAMFNGPNNTAVNFPARGQNYNNNMGLKCVTIFQTDKTGTIIAVSHQGHNCGGEWAPKKSS